MTKGVYPREPLPIRFERKVDRSGGPDACHPWLGDRDRKGYGRFWMEGRNVMATHVALQLDGRPMAPDLQACHTCDNPPCVNARHLFEGTGAANIADKVAKGRAAAGDRNGARRRPETRARGEANGNARLTAASVRVIRLSPLSAAALAEHLSVGKTAVKDVRTGRTWSHVE